MKIIAMFVGLLVLPLSGVLADPHTQCSCSKRRAGGDWEYDWELTFNTCVHNFDPSIAKYDHGNGRCTTTEHHRIDGDRWEGDCKAQANSGWYPVNGDSIDTTQPIQYWDEYLVKGFCPKCC